MIWLKRIFFGLAGLLLAGWLALVGYAYWPTGIAEVPARSLANPGDQFVSVNGLELRYHTWGEPTPGKPVDFDYQNPNQAQMMKDFIRALGLKNVVIGGHSLGGEFEQLRALMPNNTAVLVPTSGHYVQEEAPAETAAAMNVFVERVLPAGP